MITEEKTKPFADIYEQATKNYEQALKTGLKAQQDALKWWSTHLTEVSAPDLQKRAKTIVDELIPQTQKNMDQWLKVMETNSRTGIDLLKKATAVAQATTLQEAQTRVFGLWEAGLNATCETAQALTQANSKTLESWFDYTRRTGAQAQASAKS